MDCVGVHVQSFQMNCGDVFPSVLLYSFAIENVVQINVECSIFGVHMKRD